LPEPHFVRQALERVPLRVHQDVVVTHQMLVEPADTVVLLPAATRYEQPGGATETSTERYIYFSPEIPGRRIGEARPEWQVFMEVAERVDPERRHLIHFDNGPQIRQEIAKAMPFYDGIQHLSKAGDAVQWGGERLCEGGRFPTSDGRARFTALAPPELDIPAGRFLVSTRRGKQFNSMVYDWRDPLTGARRDGVFMSSEDAEALGLGEGDPVLLRSQVGEFQGKVKIVPIRSRNLQVHWPEGTVLIRRGISDPECGIPDYNAVVEVIPANGGRGRP
ncbi:MAG: molybdopterin oxidoreductase family protein, partial [Anaerolineae bacterium]